MTWRVQVWEGSTDELEASEHPEDLEGWVFAEVEGPIHDDEPKGDLYLRSDCGGYSTVFRIQGPVGSARDSVVG